MKQNNKTEMINVALLYAFLIVDESVIDEIIIKEFTTEEKHEIILKLDDQSKYLILSKLGFENKFLKTII